MHCTPLEDGARNVRDCQADTTNFTPSRHRRSSAPHEEFQANRMKPFEKGLYGLEGRAVHSLPYKPF